MPELQVVEVAQFRTLSNTDDADLVMAARSMTERFLSHQPGFLRRELLKSDDGSWEDLRFWQSRAHAESALSASMQSPEALSFFRLIEPSSIRSRLFQTLL